MRLIKCYVENFGLLHATEFNFSKGLNSCISDNGTGKTTLAAFIEAMLYGIGDTRRQALDENPRKKYMPWQGGRFGGSLTLEAGKKKYLIERSFGQRPADDTFRLLDADSGKESSDFGENVGEALFGIDRDGFLRTVYLSEKNLGGKNENKSISAKLSDLVGVDGDVGGFDDAIKLLEERRKFYFKKGNTGEIANVKERILEVDRELDSLVDLKHKAASGEERLRAIHAERGRISALEGAERSKLENIHRQKERTVNEERYATMMEALASEKLRLEKANAFFAQGIPSAQEIDRARDCYIEGKRLNDEALASRGNEEYVMLSEFFKSGADFVEIAEMERCAELLEEKTDELKRIENESDLTSVEMRGLFPMGAPTKDELSGVKKASKSPSFAFKICGAILGVILLLVGFIIGSTAGYIMSAAGAVIAVLSVILMIKRTKSQELLSLFRKYSIDTTDTSSSYLYNLEEKLERYESLKAARTQRSEELLDERCALTMKVCAFLEKYPITVSDSMLGSVRIIKSKYADYYRLGLEGERTENGKVSKLQRSEELIRQAKDFLMKFPTESGDPFTEIRDRLGELNYLRTSVARLNQDCDSFAVKYNVTGKKATDDYSSEAAIRSAIAELSEKQKALSAEYALVERELLVMRDAIEREDELRMQKDELEELYKKHTHSLDVIRKTSAYLDEACSNITSKYLGKTKEKFKEYVSLIDDADGEYTLSTSFELSKAERGAVHGIDSYSRGMRDTYALALRLALVDALYQNEVPFIILDDPFIALDDSKLERAKVALKALGKSKQILYFTCAKSRKID